MSQLLENYSLQKLNTFGFDVKSRYFFSFDDEEDLIDLLERNELTGNDVLVVGEGSNLLFIEDYDGLVIYPQNKTLEILQEEDNSIYIRVGAGYNWDKLVEYCVEHEWGGLENLSKIPGNVGASPVQNIGAYGVEVCDCIHSVDIVNIETGDQEILEKHQCEFGYRDSIFKKKYKNLFVVTHVIFELKKNHVPMLSYGYLKDEVVKLGKTSISNIRKAVISIRDSKLPDPEILGNAGSFFKNPVISSDDALILKAIYGVMPEYKLANGDVKLAAAWLIDKCGFKGLKEGDVGVHKDQALVLVNYGKGKGMDIVHLANRIRNAVFNEFGIMLEQEVKVV
ncbi:MAG: UDP-N-acetylmuramate dehydrogenase [Marinifilaceae bacterium]